MADPESKFTLREMQRSDSNAVERLISNFDGDLVTHFQVDAYTAIVSGSKYRTIGVVVESAGYDGLVGMGTLRFGRVQFNGDSLPFAFLDGLKVHPDFRKQGLGSQIADWRVQKALEMFGDGCLIGTGMEVNNHASRAVAQKWCREFIDPAIGICILPVRKRPPKSRRRITVREIEPHEMEAFTAGQNSFYKEYNLYEPGDAESLKSMLEASIDGKKLYRCYAAFDPQGNLLAGAQTWARGLLKSDSLVNPPAELRIVNNLFHLLPSDFTIRDIAVQGIWHQPGHIRAANYLWESICWLCKDQGTTIVTGFDPRDPVQEVVNLKPWHQPRPKITLAIHGPTPIDRGRLLFGTGRV